MLVMAQRVPLQFSTCDASTDCCCKLCCCHRFGFNNRMTALNGLWAGGASATSDFAAIAHQLKLLGFNTIRLPFLFDDLKSPASKVISSLSHHQHARAQHLRHSQRRYSCAMRTPC